ncbi:MAG TPA: hypothetical protein PLQ18_09235, partial [Plasticicumulans sp.]|nr:hypothetical protein [Plasticicumulans sp.]
PHVKVGHRQAPIPDTPIHEWIGVSPFRSTEIRRRANPQSKAEAVFRRQSRRISANLAAQTSLLPFFPRIPCEWSRA